MLSPHWNPLDHVMAEISLCLHKHQMVFSWNLTFPHQKHWTVVNRNINMNKIRSYLFLTSDQPSTHWVRGRDLLYEEKRSSLIDAPLPMKREHGRQHNLIPRNSENYIKWKKVKIKSKYLSQISVLPKMQKHIHLFQLFHKFPRAFHYLFFNYYAVQR